MKIHPTDLHLSSASGGCIAATGEHCYTVGDALLVRDEEVYLATVTSASRNGSTYVRIDHAEAWPALLSDMPALRELITLQRHVLAARLIETLPWAMALPAGERALCVDELIDDLADGAGTGDFETFYRDLVAWRSTAAVWAAPALLEQLTSRF